MRLDCPHCGEPIDLAVRSVNSARADADDELRELVLATVRAHAPIAANAVQLKVRRRRADVRAALTALESAGRLHRGEDDLWTPAPVPDAPDTPERDPYESNGHNTTAVAASDASEADRAERLIRDHADLAAHDA